jgi:uncharacterized ferredoxin-like protein
LKALVEITVKVSVQCKACGFHYRAFIELSEANKKKQSIKDPFLN